MTKAVLPDFLIIGAPKCGTTALHNFIEQHPDIALAKKEIHFFGKDLGYTVPRPQLKKYTKYFKSDKLNGDSSVWYLYSDTIFKELDALNISPKLIVMLRNPIEVAYAMHSQNLMDANEDEPNFEKALQLEPLRKTGKKLPPKTDLPRASLYTTTADFLPRIQFLLSNYDNNKVFFGLQEELLENPKKFMQSIELFLSLKEFDDYHFEKVNSNKVIKNKTLHNSIKKPSRFKKRLIRTLIPHKGIRSRIIHKLYESNFNEASRTALSAESEIKLKTQFHHNTSQLGKLINKNIDHWL